MSSRFSIVAASARPSRLLFDKSFQVTRLQASFLSRDYSVSSPVFDRPLTKGLRSRENRRLHLESQRASKIRGTVPGGIISNQCLYSTKVTESGEPIIHDVFESKTGTWQYVIADPSTSTAAIIDPVLDYDPSNQALETGSADALLSLVKENGYKIDMILETHAHADHITAASYIQRRLAEEQGHKPLIGIGKRIGQVQEMFARRYGVPEEECTDVYDILFDDDQVFKIGQLTATAFHLPGHTPDHLGYKFGGKT